MAARSSADQAFVRELNLSLVLRYLLNEAPVSRAQIAQATGLNKSTVSSLVEDLIARRLVHEIGMNSIGTGRPSTLMEINPLAGSVIGVELGVDFLAVVLTDFTGKILWQHITAADPSDPVEKILARTLTLAQQAIDFCQAQALEPLGLGISTPGTVDIAQGVLVFAPNLDWRNVPIQQFFEQHTGLDVYVENDANAAAVAEHLFGAARQCQDFIFVYAGVGIGGGLFLNGKLYRGNNGYAGEIGHAPIRIEPFQALCHCGSYGCWETYANQASILQRVQDRLDRRQDSILTRMIAAQNTSLSISILKDAADAGDPDVLGSLAEAGEAMGQGFAILVNILNPEKIILGGPLSVFGDYLLPSIVATAAKHALPEIKPTVEITVSSFKSDASLVGAVSVVVDDILSNPTRVERRK